MPCSNGEICIVLTVLPPLNQRLNQIQLHGWIVGNHSYKPCGRGWIQGVGTTGIKSLLRVHACTDIMHNSEDIIYSAIIILIMSKFSYHSSVLH